MNFYSKYKNFILAGVLIIVAFIAYSYFFTGTSTPALSSTPVATTTSSVDQDLIALLSTLRSIKLDESIFADPAFQSLQDFSQQLVIEPVGRANPFAPLGSVSQPSVPPKK